MSALIVIPARYGSTRFPGKSLALLQGKPIIQWVWEAASKCKGAKDVIVATDDKRIYDAVIDFGGSVAMTSKRHRSGTDRVAEVAAAVRAKVVVNVQGDEPLLDPRAVDKLITAMAEPHTLMATLAHRLTSEAEWRSPEVVKVALDLQGNALTFSRSPLPFMRKWEPKVKLWRHVGIYAFRAAALQMFVSWKPSALEKAESLEQLRALENGLPIRVLETKYHCIGVDTPADLKAVEKRLRK